jgi:serine/threonine protein kinase
MQGTAEVMGSFVKPGDIVAGKYKIIRILGEGGMGIVVEAMHQTLDQRVAIKFHRPQTTGGADSVARFLREAKSAAQIKSEHVVRVTDVAVLEDGDPYFVMEYLEGRDLDSLIQTEGPLSIATALDYTLQVCEALAEAHALGIVHRDLKPANLFLANRADGSVVIKLLDFGISKLLPKGADAELSMTKTRALMGSPLYMAPEQMRSTRRVDHRADIWSLGVLMHEILTGETPFLGETLPEVCASIAADDPIPLTAKRPDAPAELEEVILRCLEKDPENRFADVADIAMSLAPIAPPEAERSIARIVRILRGQLTPTVPPVGRISLRTTGSPPRPSTPFASVVPGGPASDPNADTMCIEPSDQRRSGVAAKQRIRASAPDPHQVAETMAATAPSIESVPPQSSKKKLAATIAVALAVGAAAALLLSRPHAAASSSGAANSTVTEARAASPSPPPVAEPLPAAPPTAAAAASADLPQGVSIEFVDMPDGANGARATSDGRGRGGQAGTAAQAALHNLQRGKGSQVPGKGDRAEAGAQPAGSNSANAPAPSGTAAFGAARD